MLEITCFSPDYLVVQTAEVQLWKKKVRNLAECVQEKLFSCSTGLGIVMKTFSLVRGLQNSSLAFLGYKNRAGRGNQSVWKQGLCLGFQGDVALYRTPELQVKPTAQGWIPEV